ncbi:MAG: hypothetical protein A2283_10240 [Lentisphaerae bacterium RIFOXYA12_FULL_48_11]|nr:MAG: hypothetical protein A2283_10240 [Lentisphaerae bacterium RIFOXYA12_FULL_48_11]
MKRCAILFVLFALCHVSAQEVFFLGGPIQSGGDDSSYTVQYEYDEGLGENLFASLSYINEGHFADHHRDGCAAQIWFRSNILDRRLSLAAGIGPYGYFDTTRPAGTSDTYTDEHGAGTIASLAATWYTAGRLMFRLRANGIWADDMDTVSILLGVGCQLESRAARGPVARASVQDPRITDNELTFLYGLTIVNSFDSESSPAVSIEYRRGLLKYLEWTMAWLGEGENEMIDRNGFVSQLWLTRSFLEDSVALGFGGGVYYASDKYSVDDTDVRMEEKGLSGIISFTGVYRLNESLGVRVTLNRVLTNYDRDTDILLGGVSYHF